LRVLAAIRAFYREHFVSGSVAGAIAITVAVAAAASIAILLCFPCLTASWAALGRISIASGRELFLFFNTKSKSSAAIGTLDGLVLISHWMTSFFNI
jgi:hypothetical protein